MIRSVFFAFVALALLGDARIFLFILNRVVFGSHRQERNPTWPLIVAVPLPVVPVPDFIAHAPPQPLLRFANVWFRAPGDVVVNELKVASFCVAANITTASLAKLVLIAGAVAVVAFADDTP